MKIWELLGGLVALIILILWIKWLRTPSPSATWPRQFTLRVPFLYIVPVFLLAFSAIGITEFALSLGAPKEIEVYTYGIPALLLIVHMVMGILDFFGVPAAPILVPRWIREQDRKSRAQKRAARRRRWQDPKVKRSEIWFNIALPFIVLGIIAAIFLVTAIVRRGLIWLVEGY